MENVTSTESNQANRRGIEYACSVQVRVKDLAASSTLLYEWITKMALGCRCVTRINPNQEEVQYIIDNTPGYTSECRSAASRIFFDIFPISDAVEDPSKNASDYYGGSPIMSFLLMEDPTVEKSPAITFTSFYDRVYCSAAEIAQLFYYICEPKSTFILNVVYGNSMFTVANTLMQASGYYMCYEMRTAIRLSTAIDGMDMPYGIDLRKIHGAMRYSESFNARKYLIDLIAKTEEYANFVFNDRPDICNLDMSSKKSSENAYQHFIRKILKKAIPSVCYRDLWKWYNMAMSNK